MELNDLKTRLNELKINLQDAIDKEDWEGATVIIIDLKVIESLLKSLEEIRKTG